MKMLFLLAGVATLAACGGGDPVVEDNAMAEETVVIDDTPAIPNYAGSFEDFDGDGNPVGTTVTNPDGTYTFTMTDGSVETGAWRTNDDGQLCFDADGDTPENCWTPGEVVDGKTKWTGANGEIVLAVHTPT